MANRSKAETHIFITTAATLFAQHTRDANEIAAILGTARSSIHRWSKSPRWSEVLETLGYEGERHFRVQSRRDAQRENADDFDAVKVAYEQAQDTGVPKWKISSIVSNQTGVKYWKVRQWARDNGWDA